MNQLERFLKFKEPRSTQLHKFFECLKSGYPTFERGMEKATFEKEGITDINGLGVRFGRILKEFLAYLQMQEDDNTREFLHLNWIKNQSDLMETFFDKAENLETKWGEQKREGIEHLYRIYQLKKIAFTHPGFLKQDKFSTQPKTILDLLEKYYAINKLYWSLILYFNNQHVRDRTKPQIEVALEHILELGDHLIKDVPTELLQKIIKALTQENFEGNPTLFDNDRLEEAYTFFTDHEITDVISFLTQIGYKNYQKEIPNSLENLFAINKFSFEKGNLVQNNTISSDVFHNIINIACAVGELDWVKKFIDETGTYLGKGEREAGIALGKARYFFEKGEYDKVISLLENTTLHTIFYKLQKRALILLAYFEKDSDDFMNSSHAFREFLHSQRSIPDCQKEAFKNFVKFSKQLFRNFQNKKEKKLLQDEIKSCSNVVHKDWLMKKV